MGLPPPTKTRVAMNFGTACWPSRACHFFFSFPIRSATWGGSERGGGGGGGEGGEGEEQVGHLHEHLVVLLQHVVKVAAGHLHVPDVDGLPLEEHLGRLPPLLGVRVALEQPEQAGVRARRRGEEGSHLGEEEEEEE